MKMHHSNHYKLLGWGQEIDKSCPVDFSLCHRVGGVKMRTTIQSIVYFPQFSFKKRVFASQVLGFFHPVHCAVEPVEPSVGMVGFHWYLAEHEGVGRVGSVGGTKSKVTFTSVVSSFLFRIYIYIYIFIYLYLYLYLYIYIYLYIFIWNPPFACSMWLGARAAAVLPQAIGRAGSGSGRAGRSSQLSQRTTARDKNYLATIIINVTTWNENKTKVDDLSHLYYLLVFYIHLNCFS